MGRILSASPEERDSVNRKKVFGAIGLVLMVALGVYRRIPRSTFPTEPEMATIMNEAAGSAPIPDLLHPYSFAVDPYRQGAVTGLRSLKDLDQQHLAAVQRFPEVAQSNLIAAGVSEAEANAFAAGTKKGEGGGIDDFSRATDLELKWIDALLELYQFAEDNRTHIGMHTTAELTFDDENVRSQFMALARKVDDLADESAKVAAVFDSVHRRHRQRMSFTTRDAGQP